MYFGRVFFSVKVNSFAALCNNGGDHAIGLLKTQLQQVIEQVCSMKVEDFKNTLAYTNYI